MNYAVGTDAPTWLCIDSPAYQARKCEHYTCKGDIKLAYGVDTHPSPPELPSGHWEWDMDDDGRPIKYWVQDYNEDGAKIEEQSDYPCGKNRGDCSGNCDVCGNNPELNK